MSEGLQLQRLWHCDPSPNEALSSLHQSALLVPPSIVLIYQGSGDAVRTGLDEISVETVFSYQVKPPLPPPPRILFSLLTTDQVWEIIWSSLSLEPLSMLDLTRCQRYRPMVDHKGNFQQAGRPESELSAVHIVACVRRRSMTQSQQYKALRQMTLSNRCPVFLMTTASDQP